MKSIKIKKLIFALPFIIMLLVAFQSCSDNQEEELSTQEVQNNFLNDSSSNKLVSGCGHGIHDHSNEISKRQSHAPSLVSDANIGSILIFSEITDQVPAFSTGYTWGQALDGAADLWNAAGSSSCINIDVTTNPDLADITIKGPSGPNGGLPSDADHVFGWVEGNPFCGRPYPVIFINTNFEDVDPTIPSSTKMINIIAHEIGHAIGFRHVEDPYGIHIPGTPISNDPNSIMTENIIYKSDTDFTGSDDFAIDYLYGCTSPFNDEYIGDQGFVTISSISPDSICYTEELNVSGYFGTCDESDSGTIKLFLVENDGTIGVPVSEQIATGFFTYGQFSFTLNLSDIPGFNPNIGYNLFATLVGSDVNSSTIQLNFIDCSDECIGCNEAFEEIVGNLQPTEECGQFEVTVPVSILECYSIIFHGPDGDTQLTDESYTFAYSSNGTYSLALSIIDLVTGEKCSKNKFEVIVDCFEECIACNEAFEQMVESLQPTDQCGEYEVSVPVSILECYSVEFHWLEGSVDLTDESYTFTYSSNGTYSVAFSIYDLVTGKKCYEKKYDLVVDCFEDECQENPLLELSLANHLKDILNSILELNNGFTGNCVSGSSSTWVNITDLPEVIEFMDNYDLELRLQNALDIREQLYGSYPYYTADIQNVYYKWGKNTNGNPPCLTITFANGTIGSGDPIFKYVISGGMDDQGDPISNGLNVELIESFTNIEINVAESKATIEYVDTNGDNQSIYDILWPYTIVEGAGNGLKYCWFHDLEF